MNKWCILQDACLLVADCETHVAGFSLVTAEQSDIIYTPKQMASVGALCAAPSARGVLICINRCNKVIEVDVGSRAVRRTYFLKAFPTCLSEVACNHLHVVVQSCPEAVVYVFGYNNETLQAVIRPSVFKTLGLVIRPNNRGFIVTDEIGFCYYGWRGGACERRCAFPTKCRTILDSSVAGDALVSSWLPPGSGLISDEEYLVGVDLEARQMFANARPAFSGRDLKAHLGLTYEYVHVATAEARALMVVVSSTPDDLHPLRVYVNHGLALRLAWVQAGVMGRQHSNPLPCNGSAM